MSVHGKFFVGIQEGRLNRNTDSQLPQDYYIQLIFGNEEKKTRVIQNGGKNPKFNQSFVFLKHEEVQITIVLFEQFNKQPYSPVAIRDLGILQFVKECTKVKKTIELQYQGDYAGEVDMTFEFLPDLDSELQNLKKKKTKVEGEQIHKLILSYFSANLVREPKNFHKDVQIQLLLGKKPKPWESSIISDVGNNPHWGDRVKIDLKNETELTLRICDFDNQNRKPNQKEIPSQKLGECVLKIPKVFKQGIDRLSAKIYLEGEPAGEIFCVYDYSIPQFKPVDQQQKPAPTVQKGVIQISGIRGYYAEESNERLDSFLVFKLDNSKNKKTELAAKQGPTPGWKDRIAYYRVYENQLDVDVWKMGEGKEELLGSGAFKLQSLLYQQGKLFSQQIVLYTLVDSEKESSQADISTSLAQTQKNKQKEPQKVKKEVGNLFFDIEFTPDLINAGSNNAKVENLVEYADHQKNLSAQDMLKMERKKEQLSKRKELMKSKINKEDFMFSLPFLQNQSKLMLDASNANLRNSSPNNLNTDLGTLDKSKLHTISKNTPIKNTKQLSLPKIGKPIVVKELKRSYKDYIYKYGMSVQHSAYSLRHSVPIQSFPQAARFAIQAQPGKQYNSTPGPGDYQPPLYDENRYKE